jgi:hypothetical protein
MMGLQNLCTLFGPTLIKLSPKDNLQVEDMNREIRESMQQAQVLFYILQLHSNDRLINDESNTNDTNTGLAKIEENEPINENTDNTNNSVSENEASPLRRLVVDSNNNSLSADSKRITTSANGQLSAVTLRKPSMQTAL